MRTRQAILIVILGLCALIVPADAAKDQGWQLYGGNGDLEGESKSMKIMRKEWKEGGKREFDPAASPNPYTLLSGRKPVHIVLVDNAAVKRDREYRLRPGSHTVVIVLYGGNFVSQDCFQFRARLEAGHEYQVSTEIEKKIFRKGHWTPFLRYRKIP